jgi:hypothetical protein
MGGSLLHGAVLSLGTVALLGVGPADSLDTGCGGGETGGGSGLSITSDGQVASWRRAGPAPGPRVIRKTWADTARASRIFRALHDAGFRSLPHGKPSNWTCFFTLSDAQGTHEVLFQKPGLPKALVELDSLIQVLAREAEGT